MLAYTRLPCGKHPHSIQAEDVLYALCNFFVSEMHEGRRVYIPEIGYTTRSNSVRYVGVNKNVLGLVLAVRTDGLILRAGLGVSRLRRRRR